VGNFLLAEGLIAQEYSAACNYLKSHICFSVCLFTYFMCLICFHTLVQNLILESEVRAGSEGATEVVSIFGPNRDEVVEVSSQLYNEQLRNLSDSRSI
jgi:hypothetical protein